MAFESFYSQPEAAAMTREQTIVLITGATQGLGYELAKNLLLNPTTNYRILLGSRSLDKGQAAAATLSLLPSIHGTVSPIQLDVTQDTSVDAASKLVEEKYGRIDVLVNNAGIWTTCENARDAYRKIFDVNVIGSVSVTEAFLPLLLESASLSKSHPSTPTKIPRLIFISSSVGSISQAFDPTSKYYNPLPAANPYRASKAAINMLVAQYHGRLKGEGVLVHGADPGLCATDFTGDAESLRKRGAVEPSVGAERMAGVVRGERDADVGRVCGVYGVSPW